MAVTLRVKQTKDTKEWIVAVSRNGKHSEVETYYAIDKQDAMESRAAMADEYALSGETIILKQLTHSSSRSILGCITLTPITRRVSNVNDKQVKAFVSMYKALSVMLLDERIAVWLEKSDPKAYEQAKAAVTEAEQCTNFADLPKPAGETTSRSASMHNRLRRLILDFGYRYQEGVLIANGVKGFMPAKVIPQKFRSLWDAVEYLIPVINDPEFYRGYQEICRQD